MAIESGRDQRIHALIRAVMEVCRHPVCGFLEAIYQGAFQQDLMLEIQVINDLNAMRNEIGLLLTFARKSLEYRRFFFSKSA